VIEFQPRDAPSWHRVIELRHRLIEFRDRDPEFRHRLIEFRDREAEIQHRDPDFWYRGPGIRSCAIEFDASPTGAATA
jgi:hypothetical protein